MYQCFVDMEPFICKTLLILSILLKPFLNGQAVSKYAFFQFFWYILLRVASAFLHIASELLLSSV